MPVCVRDRSAQTVVRAATLRWNLRIKLAILQYIDPGPTSPTAEPITPGSCQGIHCSFHVYATGRTRPEQKKKQPKNKTKTKTTSRGKLGSNSGLPLSARTHRLVGLVVKACGIKLRSAALGQDTPPDWPSG